MKKRVISFLMIFTMLFSFMPNLVFAKEPTEGENHIDNKEIPETASNNEENVGFPDYVTILPKGTEYTFSEDETSIFIYASDLEIKAGDTFAIYIGDFPAAYVAESVVPDEGGVTVEVNKAPAEVYENLHIDVDLDVEDAIVTPNEEAGVSSVVEENAVVFSDTLEDENEYSVQGTVTVTLSGFRISSEASPTLYVDYTIKFSGQFSETLTQELGKIRFLGVGTFDFSVFTEMEATAELTKSGTFAFGLNDDASQGALQEDEIPVVTKMDGKGKVKLGIQVAVGVDVFTADVDVITGTAGVAGVIKSEDIGPDNHKHQHLEFEYYVFASIGIVNLKMGAEFNRHIVRICNECIGTLDKDPDFTFSAALSDTDIFEVDTSELEALLKILPRMLCGSPTIKQYTELNQDSAVEAISTLTIAENQTLVVNGNMEQRGNIVLEKGACLVVNGDYLHEGGTLRLGEDAQLVIDGDYTIKNALNQLLTGGKITFEISVGGSYKVTGEDDEKLSLSEEECYELSDVSLRQTVLKLSAGSSVAISGNLQQEGGNIEGGYYTKACNITVGEEGSASGGDYIHNGGELKIGHSYNIKIHGNYSLSGGSVDLSYNRNGPGALFEVSKNYSQSGGKATFDCDMKIDGNIDLSGTAEVYHRTHKITLGGNFSQKEESCINANTIQFRSGCTHIVWFESPEKCGLKKIICENPVIDKIDVQNGIPTFCLGSSIETVGDLRLVNGTISGADEMWFQGNRLIVHGDLIQDGSTLGMLSGNGEVVQIEVDGNYIIADGLLWANDGFISIGEDFLMQGYDADTKVVDSTEPSTGGFRAEDVTMTVGGSVEIYCKTEDGNDGFCFEGPIDGATLSVQGDLIQRNSEGSDPYSPPFELHGDYELLLNGEFQTQTISFETEPKVNGYSGIVKNQNPAGLNWGDNTDKLKALLYKCPGEHTVSVLEAVAATCIESGITEGKWCSECGEVLAAQESIPAKGHSYANGKCSVCGAINPDYEDPTPIENPFVDVTESDYFYTPVLWAVQNGITGGTSANTFSPNNPCTRGQVVTFLWAASGRAEPKSDDNPFSDVSESDYYYKAVLWAVENGITGGIGNGKFGPDQPCTRAQVATFLWKSQGGESVDAVNSFSDVASDAYYYNAVLWAVENGITGGVGNNCFGPDQTCTRGQIATFLYKAIG